MTAPTSGLSSLLSAIADQARATGAFASVELIGNMVSCKALTNEEAAYRVEPHDAGLCITWVSPNRYLSQSIEADLMWTKDDLDELLAEELTEVGYSGPPLKTLDHYRNEEKLFTFRGVIPAPPASLSAADLVKCLLAFSATFGQLGDMKPGEDED
jgi:hypothetical protein